MRKLLNLLVVLTLMLYLPGRLPCEASLSFVLSMLVDEKRVTLMQNPSLYKDWRKQGNNSALAGKLEDIRSLPLEGQVAEGVQPIEIRFFVLVDNLGFLSIQSIHGHADSYYGITFDPTGAQEVILKGEIVQQSL